VTAANAGLRSNTGWVEDGADAPGGSSSLIPIGAGMVLVAGVGAVAVLRRRTAPQE
jgi:MYXO-CTERM domain-containing protein